MNPGIGQGASPKPPFRLPPGSLMLLAGLLAGFSVAVSGFQRAEFLRNARMAEGTVVEVRAVEDSEGDVLYYPRIRFTSGDGRAMVHEEKKGTPVGSAFRTGMHVPVLYLPTDPRISEIGKTRYVWTSGMIISGVAAVFLIGAGLRLLLSGRGGGG